MPAHMPAQVLRIPNSQLAAATWDVSTHVHTLINTHASTHVSTHAHPGVAHPELTARRRNDHELVTPAQHKNENVRMCACARVYARVRACVLVSV